MRIASVALLAALSAAPLAQGQPVEQRSLVVGRADSAPARSTADVLAILEQHKPDPAKTRRLREILARTPPQTSDPIDLARYYTEHGRAAGELGLLQQQVEDLRKAYDLMPAKDLEKIQVFVELAVGELGTGDYAAALRRFEEAPRIAPHSAGRMSAWSLLASARAASGDLPGARRALREAESLLAGLRSSSAWVTYGKNWEAGFERGRGQILRYEGKFAEAESALKRTVVLYKEFIELIPEMTRRELQVPTLAQAHRNLFVWENHMLVPVLLEQGKYAEAEWRLRDSLKSSLTVFGRDSVETAWTLVRFSQVVFEQGRFDEAAELGKAAVAIYEKVGVAPYASFLGQARMAVAAALVERGRYGEAVAQFEVMRKGLEQSPEPGQNSIRGANTAWIYSLGQLGRSAEAVEQALGYHRYQLKIYGENTYSTMEARGFLALALAADEKHDEALREFRAAIPALLAAASERSGDEGLGLARSIRLRRILNAYIALLGRFAADGRRLDDLDPVGEAFRVVDAARGSTVQRALVAASARAAIRDPELAKLAREEQDAEQRIGSLSGILLDLLRRPPEKSLPMVIAAMRKDIDELRKRRTQIKQAIEKRFPDYANLIDPKPLPLEQAQKLLAPGEALLVLYGTENRTFVWAVPREGAPRFHMAALGRDERDRLVAALRSALDFADTSLERFPRFDVAAAHKLYAELIAPVEPAWKDARSLLIVPHGSLGQLPFSLLVTAPSTVAEGGAAFEGYKAVPWLVRRVAVTQLPSVNTLASLRTVKRSRLPSKSLLGFGDPVFGAAPVAQAQATRSVRVRAAPFADGKRLSSQLAQLAPLPDTAEELRAIALAVGGGEQDLYLGRRASEHNVKSLNLEDRRILAFATHGLVAGDLDGLTQPALALSNPQITGEKDADGLLAMDEILGLRLNADWVVLSACNTAAAEGAGGEAISGLGRAFFYAGARALLVSNWPVETVSARLLTTQIFKRQAADPKLARAEALRQAMLHVLDNESGRNEAGKITFHYAHPMFWAPFSLVGDGS